MLTELGKVLRKLRIDRDERLLDMAKKLALSVSFLSAVETGRKSPPVGFEDLLIETYGLVGDAANEVRLCADRSRDAFVVEPRSTIGRDVSALFARRINVLTDEEMDDIKKILAGETTKK